MNLPVGFHGCEWWDCGFQYYDTLYPRKWLSTFRGDLLPLFSVSKTTTNRQVGYRPEIGKNYKIGRHCISLLHFFFLSFWRNSPPPPSQWARATSFTRFLDHTQRRTTVGRTAVEEWSVRRRDLYLTTQHSRQTSIHVVGGIRTHNLSRRAAADLRLRLRGHWDRHNKYIINNNNNNNNKNFYAKIKFYVFWKRVNGRNGELKWAIVR